MGSVMNYEDNILAAIQTIVNDAVDHASYDKTIQATIKKVVDATTGKYRISYQDSVFNAYATSADITYSVGTNVYVLIPGNDMSRTKTILGTVDNLGADFINILTNEEIYESMGVNIANSTGDFGLNSYTSEQLIKLYDVTDNINLIGLNTEDAEMYIKQNDYLTLGAYFKTNLSNEQKAKGNYGISFDFIYENELGENEHRICTIDIDSFNGSPYDLLNYTKQTSTYINYDKDKFKYIDSISIFESGFPYERSGEPNDIFVKDIQIFGARKIPEEDLASCMLSILTPQGTYFKTTDASISVKKLKAQIRVKGKIAGEYSDTRFYWFRENAAVTKNIHSDLYCSFGGSGWECLNQKNALGDGIYEWVPADENFSITKADLMLQENRYKCVALYNDGDIVLSREITLYNKSAATMAIESSNGQQFYFDMGQTVLSCTLSETLPNLTYTWRNIYDILDEETTDHITVLAKDINRYDIYQCTVYSGDNYIGTASIILYNSLDKTENTKIIINNGSQVFKYTVDGIAPNNASIEKPITILPLSFVLFDDDGAEITQEKIAASAIEWLVPAENTMLLIPDGYGIPTQEDEWNVYKNLRSLNFNILTRYDANKEHNVIKLRVTLGDRVYTAETNLIFLKEGERGSNGTDFVCKVIPNISGDNFVNQPVVTIYNNSYDLNYTPAQTGCWFKVQLWHDGELIYEGTADGNSTENKAVDLSWSVLQNSYSSSIKDDSNITINKETGVVTFNTTEYIAAANIVQCKVLYDGVEYYDNIPIITTFLDNNNYSIKLKENSGFNYAVYESDGRNPKFDNSTPFEIIVSQSSEDISLAENTTYTWAVGGTYYEHGSSHDIINLLPITSYIETHNLTKNQKRYKPIDSYDGLCVNNCIECYVEDGNTSIGTIYIPIDLYINRYGNAALNNWNGNSIQIRENDGLILSPQIGAGKKENDNTFTGMFMGDVQENATTERETGLFGYYHGQRTIELNAENGTAKFGKNGAGQIIIDPTQNRAIIKSGNYSSENNTGLEIDLTDPHIKFGDGSKFQVDNQGNVTATSLTIAPSQVTGLPGAIADVEDLKDTINYFEVTLNTYSITIPCSAEGNLPLANATYEVIASGTFKGQPITISNIATSDSHAGISNNVVLANQKITFGVSTGTAITDLINSYDYTFTYTINGTTYTTEKQINIVLTQQGKDGEQGPAGPAGQDGTSVTVKGSYNTITELTAAHPSGNALGDGYIVGLNLYIFTDEAGGSGSLAGDWKDVGQFKGQDAKRCFIVASTEIFKSTDGGVTYSPTNTILTPFFQSVVYSNWAYSTNGGASFTTINPNNLPNGVSIDNDAKLTLLKTSTLFDINSTLVFKCNTDDANVFDTITIAKVTDGQNSSTAFLSNTSISFVGSADTGIVAPTTATTNVIGYQGTTKTTCSLGTITGDIPTGMTVTAGNAVDNEIPITITISGNNIDLGGAGSRKGTIIIPVYTPVQTTLYLNWLKLNTGQTGYNTARVYLYTRASETPSAISYSGNLTYTFSTSTLNSVPTGWTQSIPADDGNPLYVSTAVAYSNTATDTIAANEWTTPVKYVEDGSPGTPGADAKVLNISASPAQTFTRANSSAAYTPSLITLIPETTNCSVGKWYYNKLSNNTWTWTEITSSTSSTTAAYKSGNNLCVPSGITYNSNATSVTFKCVADDNSCSDVMTVVKLSNGDNGTSVTITGEVISYGYSSNGTDSSTVTNWSTSIPAVPDQYYLWTRTVVSYSDGSSTTSYSVAYQSKDGTDATQYYTYVRYASSATPTASDISESSTGKTYIGVAITTSSTAPTAASGYTWTKFVGENGFSVWTTTATPTQSNVNWKFNISDLVGPTGVTPRVGETILRENRYQYTITAVGSIQVTTGAPVDIVSTNIVCGKETQVIPCTKDGNTSAASTITIPFAGYCGGSRAACTVTYSTLPSGITLSSNTAATTNADGSLVFNVASNSTLGGNESGEITLTFICNSIQFVKKLTWAKARAGAETYFSYLTNESQALVYGQVQTIETYLYGYEGTTEKNVSISTINNVAATTTVTATGLPGVNFKVSSTNAKHPKITFTTTTDLPQNVANRIPIQYTVSGDSTVRTIYFSYSTTVPGYIYEIEPSVTSLVKKVDDIFAPTSVTFNAYQTIGNASRAAYAGRWLIQYSTDDGVSWTTAVTGNTNVDSYTYTPSNSNIKFIKAYLGPAGTTPTTSNALDVQTIPVLYDSVDVEIGGTNYYKNSRLLPTSTSVTLDKWNLSNSALTVQTADDFNYFDLTTSSSRRYIRQALEYSIVKDKTVTVSFEYKNSVATTLTSFYRFEIRDTITGSATGYKTFSLTLPATTTWTRCILTKDINDEFFSSGTRTGNEAYFIAGFSMYTSGSTTYPHTSLQIRKPKLEIGNVPTDWTPAPEDMDEAILNVVTQYGLSDSSTTPPAESAWSTATPTWTEGKYVWQRTLTYKVNDPNTAIASNVTCIQGAKGETGDDAYTVILSNESHTFAATKDTAVGETITITPYVYKGTTQQTGYTIGTIQGQITNKLMATVSGTPKVISVTASNTLDTQNGMLTIPITIDNKTFNKQFSWSLSKTGEDGTAAKVVTINPSSQIFKSTAGATGTFNPTYIYLYPSFQGCSYSKWQYSTDGTTWTNVTSGSNSLTIGTYNSIANSLRIQNTCNLFTDSITAVSFRCVSDTSSVYDTATIVKIYDVTDIEIGGRNLLRKSNIDIYGTTFASGEALDTSDYRLDGSFTYTRGATSNLGFYVTNYALLEPNTDYVLSFKAKVLNGSVTTFYMFGTNPNNIASSYLMMDNVLKSSNAKDTAITVDLSDGEYHNFVWGFTTTSTITPTGTYTGNILQWNKSVQTAFSIEMQGLKWEKGTIPTDWTLAPEDELDRYEIQYAELEEGDTPTEETLWGLSYAANSTSYIWQRSVSYTQGGDLTVEVAPFIIYVPTPILVLTETQYCISSIKPEHNDSGWASDVRPWTTADKDVNFRWVRTKFTYNIGPIQYSEITQDKSWETYGTLDQSVQDLATIINDDMRNGVVQIQGGSITVFNDKDTDKATAKIVINDSGIAFMYKDNQDVWQGEKAAWGFVNGQWTFNSEAINVISLKADNITNGILTLQEADLTYIDEYATLNALKIAHPSGNAIGDAYYIEDEDAIYSWTGTMWEKRESGEFRLKDKSGNNICNINAEGLEILCKDGSKFSVKMQEDENHTYNLHLYDSHGSLLAYANTANNTWVMTNAQVDVSLQIGLRVKIVPIGNGIGFIAA